MWVCAGGGGGRRGVDVLCSPAAPCSCLCPDRPAHPAAQHCRFRGHTTQRRGWRWSSYRAQYNNLTQIWSKTDARRCLLPLTVLLPLVLPQHQNSDGHLGLNSSAPPPLRPASTHASKCCAATDLIGRSPTMVSISADAAETTESDRCCLITALLLPLLEMLLLPALLGDLLLLSLWQYRHARP